MIEILKNLIPPDCSRIEIIGRGLIEILKKATKKDKQQNPTILAIIAMNLEQYSVFYARNFEYVSGMERRGKNAAELRKFLISLIEIWPRLWTGYLRERSILLRVVNALYEGERSGKTDTNATFEELLKDIS